jgi:RNA polymerase sigma-70 factor (ECF subfamily)
MPTENRGSSPPFGDEITRLYGEYAPSLFRYALTLNAAAGIAEDAVQETFLRYFLARSGGHSIDNPRPWLMRVLRNYLLDEMKSRANRKTVGLDSVAHSLGTVLNPESQYWPAETLRALAGALSAREWECVRLRAEGLRYGEIAEIMGIRTGTVGALLARAHAKSRGISARLGRAQETTEQEVDGDGAAEEPSTP